MRILQLIFGTVALLVCLTGCSTMQGSESTLAIRPHTWVDEPSDEEANWSNRLSFFKWHKSESTDDSK